MEISVVLQVALFLASLAVIVMVACAVPVAFQTRRNSEELLRHVREMKATAQLLAQDSRDLLRNLNELCRRTNRQMDEIDEVVHTVHQWTKRADRLVDEVGSAVESPLFALVRNMNRWRAGVGKFLQVLMHSNERNQTNERRKDD